MNGQGSQHYNLDNGNGFSVQEVIRTAQQVTGSPIPVQYGPRRAGDPARLVADANKAKKCLGWTQSIQILEMLLIMLGDGN